MHSASGALFQSEEGDSTMFMFALAVRILMVGLTIAIALVGVVLLTIGLVKLSRQRSALACHEPSYSARVDAPDAGEDLPEGFEDTPRHLGNDLLTVSTHSSHAAADPQSALRDVRRGALALVITGILLALLGAALAIVSWELVA